jgi:FkbH-like protein
MNPGLPRQHSPNNLRIAILANCSIELLQRKLEDALNDKHIQSDLWNGNFGQYRQLILDPKSSLYIYAPNFVLLYLDGEVLFTELLQYPFMQEDRSRKQIVQGLVSELDNLIQRLAQNLPEATLIINTIALPPLDTMVGLEYNSPFSLKESIEGYNRSLAELARRYAITVVIDVDSLASWLGYENWFDPRLWYLARMTFSQEAAGILAAHYAATIAGRLGKISKCLILDLDNTLWGGVIGEDGINGIQLGEDGIGRAFVDFQNELRNLNEKGILLAVCSKNNQTDVTEVFQKHPEMRLREEQFAAMRINWNDKVNNIQEIAEELNIGLDSLVYIDDNPVERAWVRDSLTEVFVPEWPDDPSYYKTALIKLEIDRFLKLAITVEDRQRGQQYIAQAKRKALQTAASSLEDFYRSLNMQLRICLADSYTIPRIAQLTQKTNQFNLTTRRYTDSEIAQMVQRSDMIVHWVELKDKFGNSGIIGVIILYQTAEKIWTIDTFLLSCRVLGRTVENAVLGWICQELSEKGAIKLMGEYIPTSKNKPAADLYQKMGFHRVETNNNGSVWDLDLENQKVEIPEWFVVCDSINRENENG